MADELEVLEKQQLSAQRSLNDLTDQLTLADHLVYKKYLTELQNYGMVELSQKMLEVQNPAQCIRMFQLKKLTLKKGEDMFQKLSTVYYSSMAQGCSLAVMIDVPEENAGANIYLGVREDPLKQSMKSLAGNFQQGVAESAALQLPRFRYKRHFSGGGKKTVGRSLWRRAGGGGLSVLCGSAAR